VGVRGVQQPASYVQENLGHWVREGHEREINQAVALAVEGYADNTHTLSRVS